MCVFFYFLNFNVQTAWYVNKTKTYNWMWIKYQYVFISTFYQITEHKKKTQTKHSRQITHTTAIFFIVRFDNRYCKLISCWITSLDCSSTLLVRVDVALIAYLCTTASTVRSSCIQIRFFFFLSWRYTRMDNRAITPHWLHTVYSKYIIHSYIHSIFFKNTIGTETVFNSRGWQQLKVEDPRASKSHTMNRGF